MKPLLKFLGYGFVLLVLLAAVAVYVGSNAKLEKKYAVTVRATVIPTDAEAIARGKHLAETRGCADCHGRDLAGAKVIDNPAMGRLFGPNLTRGRGGLAADYGAVDFERAIRHGLARSGRGLFLMPSTDYAHFTEGDMADLIAYVQSVPAVDRESVPVQLGPVARALLAVGKIKLAAAEIDHAALKPAIVTPGMTIDYGRYVAVSCTGCHGSNFSGGKIDIGPPDWPPAANLTPHASGRLAQWTEENFLTTLRTGKRPDGVALSPVMPRAFGAMSDTELKAIWLFLKTLPPAQTGTR